MSVFYVKCALLFPYVLTPTPVPVIGTPVEVMSFLVSLYLILSVKCGVANSTSIAQYSVPWTAWKNWPLCVRDCMFDVGPYLDFLFHFSWRLSPHLYLIPTFGKEYKYKYWQIYLYRTFGWKHKISEPPKVICILWRT